MMRIGLSTTTCEPELTQGKIDGIGTYTKNLATEFQQLGQEITPCFFPHKIGQSVTSYLPHGRKLALPYTHSTILSIALPFSIHGNLNQGIDIFHATDHMVPKLKNIPIVATIHDTLMFERPDWHSARFGNIKKIARKKTLAWADHFITISNAMVAELVEFGGIKPEKISVVYNGISPWWFEETTPEAKALVLEKFNLGKKFLLFTGTLQQKKNLPRIVQAYLQLPKDMQEAYPLVVVGRPGWGMEESMVAIQELTEKKRGYWLNYVSSEELRILFQTATLYLHPSLHEGFGLTLLEAFASKVPVLASNVTALPEIANGAAYLVDPYSVSGIRTGIETLLTNPEMQKELVQKGLTRVKDFSWAQCAKQTLAVYKQVIK